MNTKLMALITVLFFLPSWLFPCTAFMVKGDGKVFIGNNEDCWLNDAKIWFIPAKPASYGRVYVGFGDFNAEGGINEKGLFWDGFSAPYAPVLKSRNKPQYPGRLYDKILGECANIDDVVKVMNQYHLQMFEYGMWMFADANGRSIIVEGDRIIHSSGDYQIITNFRQSQLPLGKKPCWRYRKADALLKTLPDISPASLSRILEQVHQENTQYSYVGDLKKLTFTLYHFQRFDRPRVFSLPEELAKVEHAFLMVSLFPENEEFQRILQEKKAPNDNRIVFGLMLLCGLIFLATFFFGLVSGVFRYKAEKNGLLTKFWSISVCAAVGHLLFYAIPFALPKLLTYHLHDLYYAGFFGSIILRLPLANIFLLLTQGVGLAFIWKGKQEKPWLRILYSLAFSASLISILLYLYWGMIRFY